MKQGGNTWQIKKHFKLVPQDDKTFHHYYLQKKGFNHEDIAHIIRQIDNNEKSLGNLYQQPMIINMCMKWCYFKMRTKSETMGAITFPKQNGTISNKSIWVCNLKYQDNNQIGYDGCKYLSKTQWINLELIVLYGNNIGDAGCKYIAKAQWPQLLQIDLNKNTISNKGCQYLSESNWPKMKSFFIRKNKIGDDGCKYLARGNWPCLEEFSISNNPVSDRGCKYLSKANWPKMIKMVIDRCFVTAQGCKHIAKSHWKHLKGLFLFKNKIQTLGCAILASSEWGAINIDLLQNEIMKNGYKFLTAAKWLVECEEQYQKSDEQFQN